jgi:hypothetical protein
VEFPWYPFFIKTELLSFLHADHFYAYLQHRNIMLDGLNGVIEEQTEVMKGIHSVMSPSFVFGLMINVGALNDYVEIDN